MGLTLRTLDNLRSRLPHSNQRTLRALISRTESGGRSTFHRRTSESYRFTLEADDSLLSSLEPSSSGTICSLPNLSSMTAFCASHPPGMLHREWARDGASRVNHRARIIGCRTQDLHRRQVTVGR
jgi:hypothetical protein